MTPTDHAGLLELLDVDVAGRIEAFVSDDLSLPVIGATLDAGTTRVEILAVLVHVLAEVPLAQLSSVFPTVAALRAQVTSCVAEAALAQVERHAPAAAEPDDTTEA